MITVSQQVMEILGRSMVSGCMLKLPHGEKLDRPVYEAVNKVIEAAGGKWNRKAQAHLFEGDAADTIEPIILTGEYTRTKQDFGQFDTPHDVAVMATALADIHPGMTVLEPSAGIGNLAALAWGMGGIVTVIDVDAKRLEQALKRSHAFGYTADFLTWHPVNGLGFDRVLMNPPFARQADIDHVAHAFGFLKPGGVLVAIMSASITFRTNGKTQRFCELVDVMGGTIEPLDPGAFKESGTAVNTVMVKMVKK